MSLMESWSLKRNRPNRETRSCHMYKLNIIHNRKWVSASGRKPSLEKQIVFFSYRSYIYIVRFISKYFNFIEFLRYIDFVSFIKFRTSLAIIFANIHPVSFSILSWDSYYVYISTLDLLLLVSDSINFSSFFHSTPQIWSFQVAYLYAHKFFLCLLKYAI